jgi:hypothetical protein
VGPGSGFVEGLDSCPQRVLRTLEGNIVVEGEDRGLSVSVVCVL